MKPLIVGLSYDMKTIFLVFATKITLFLLLCGGGHIGMEVNKPWKF